MHTHSSDGLATDPLSEILSDLKLSGVAYGHCRLHRPWGVSCPAEPAARLHLVVAGETWLRTAELAPVRLQPGDVAFLPTGVAHELSDTPRGKTKPLASFPIEPIGEKTYRMIAGNGGAQTLMACCSVALGEASVHPVLELMPKVLVIRRATMDDALLPTILDAMAEEVLEERVGASTILARLADVVIARLLRSWVEGHDGAARGWLAAIRDPNIGRALVAVHRQPGNAWSLESLAATAALSRSTFSERFTAALGVPPGLYVARWRMHLASAWLREQRLTVSEVSHRLGYESEPSFSRAFKRIVGVPPSALRRDDAHQSRSVRGSRPGERQRVRALMR
jgi:AraC-like DNA-binding protein